MASHEAFPDIPKQVNTERITLDYFFERQASDPEFLSTLADRLWDEWSKMTPAQQDARSLVWQHMYPDDVEARETSIKAHLLSDYIKTEMESVTELNISFVADSANGPPNTAS